MKYEQVVGYFGGLTKAADALEVDRRLVHSWGARGRIPSLWQLKIEVLTAGGLPADKKSKSEATEYAVLLRASTRLAARALRIDARTA